MKYRFLRRAAAFALVLVLTLSFCPQPARGADGSEILVHDYDSNYSFRFRTKEDIAARYVEAFYPVNSYSATDKSSYYSSQPSTSAPYAAGVLKSDTLSVMAEITKYYRWLSGSESNGFSCNSESSAGLQAAAFIRNWGDFSHEVSVADMPADMNRALWNLGMNTSHNLLSKFSTPSSVIGSWLDEGYDIDKGRWDDFIVSGTQLNPPLGHRMLLLDTHVSGMQYGYSVDCAVGRYSSLNGVTQLPFTAYPAAGYMPLNDLPARTSAWSLQLNETMLRIPSEDALKITVTDENTGASYECTKANGLLRVYTMVCPVDSYTNRELQVIAFRQPEVPVGSRYRDGDRFHVVVEGLYDFKSVVQGRSGYNTQLRYTVELFDVLAYTASTVQTAVPSEFSDLSIYKTNATDAYLNALAAALPKTVTVSAKTGFSVAVPVKYWAYEPEHSRYRASIDGASLPSVLKDTDGVLNNVFISLNVTSNTDVKDVTLRTGAASVEYGEPFEFEFFRKFRYHDRSRLYRMSGSGAVLRFDSGVTAPYTNDKGWDLYRVESASYDDSGTFFGICYSPEFGSAYASNLCTVDVRSSVMTGMMITHLPNKLLYKPGEPIELEGMVCLAWFADGTTKEITDFRGLSLNAQSAPGSETVEVPYREDPDNPALTVRFTISVDNRENAAEMRDEDYLLVSKLPLGLRYEHGDTELDLTGGMLQCYRRNGLAPERVPMTDTRVSVLSASETPGLSGVCLEYEGLTVSFDVYVGPVYYTITWNVDGRTEHSAVQRGAMPEYHGDTFKLPDDLYTYTFTGWEPEIVPAVQDAVYTAVYAKTERGGAHTHQFAQAWSYDSVSHWHQCDCGAKSGNSPHSFEWVVTVPPTADTPGEQYERCGTCGYVSGVTAVIAPLPAEHADCPSAGYSDAPAFGNWAHEGIDFCIGRGLMGSVKADGSLLFEPYTKVSRAMTASILYRIAGSPAVYYRGTFSDVPAGKWYTSAVEWCAQKGLASGKGNRIFDPSGDVTRQELAVFMKKMAEYLGKNTGGRAELSGRFADAASVPKWAKEALQWAVLNGLVSGKSSGGRTLLAPADNATRAESASIVMRFVTKIAEAG